MKIKIILISIILLSFLVRSYRPSYPPLLWDEASLGYNAHSILKTGRDEYGSFLPLVFKSFGDYKPGLYVYLCLPFVTVFGLNEFSVRLPSIIIGSLLPLLFYLIGKKTTKKTIPSLLFALIVAFNPYNIHFSRGAWESNILLFEISLAILLLLNKRLFFSSIILASTLYTYQSGKLLSLLILPLFFLPYRHRFLTFFGYFIIPLFLLTLPISIRFLTQSDSNRLKVFSIFSYPRPMPDTTQIISESSSDNYLIFHQDLVYYSRAFLERYFNYFSPRFLLTEGDWQNPRHSAPYIGVLLYPGYLLLLLGIFITKPNLFHFLLLITPIPAALSRDAVSAVRSLPMTLPLCYFISIGLYTLLNRCTTKFSRYLLTIFTFIVFSLSFIYYQDLYYNHMVKRNPQEWMDGYKQAILSLDTSSTKKIIFTPFYGQPYIYYLFYHLYPPSLYQAQSQLISSGPDIGAVNNIDNILFTTPDFNQLRLNTNFTAVFSRDDALRQNIDFNELQPLPSLATTPNFYLYEK